MSTGRPQRPNSGTVDPDNPEAMRAWAAWLRIEEGNLRRLVAIIGTSAGQIEYVLGITQRSRW
jgi:hypothetical protein